MDQLRGRDGARGELEGLAEYVERACSVRMGVGVQREQGVAAADVSAHAVVHDDAHGGVDGVLLAQAACAEEAGGVAEQVGADGGDVAVFRGGHGDVALGLGKQPGVLADARVAALGCDHRGEFGEAFAGGNLPVSMPMPAWMEGTRAAFFSMCAPSVRATSRKGPAVRPASTSMASSTSRALPMYMPRGWSMSVMSAEKRRPLRLPIAHHVLSQFAGLFRRVHDGAGAGLDVEHHHVAAGGKFFGEYGGDDQRQAVHRLGDVAQGVEHLVRRGERGALAGDGAADGADDGLEFVHPQIDAHAGDGFELVQRAAGEAQPAAGHLRHLEAAGGREGARG